MKRPSFFNLTQIQMPVGAITSIAHRISGVLLALGTPVAVYLLDLSLRGQPGFDRTTELFGNPFLKLATAIYAWSLAHHVFAGIRHLLSDIDVGSRLRDARRSAWIVNIAGVAVAFIVLGVLL